MAYSFCNFILDQLYTTLFNSNAKYNAILVFMFQYKSSGSFAYFVFISRKKYTQHLVCLINTTSPNTHGMPSLNKGHEQTKP